MAYPLLLKEIKLTNSLLEMQENINVLHSEQIDAMNSQILILKEVNKSSENQINILKDQLKNSKKRSIVLPISIGVIGGFILSSVLK